MTGPNVRIAALDRARLEKLQALEKGLGTCLVAVEKQDGFDDLSEEQLKGLTAAEQEMGAILLAYKCD